MSPVRAPAASAWQSWPPIATRRPARAAANCARAASPAGRPSTSMRRQPARACDDLGELAPRPRRPFIFQLPATSGRRGALAMCDFPCFAVSDRPVSRGPAATPEAALVRLPLAGAHVATQGRPPYDARSLIPTPARQRPRFPHNTDRCMLRGLRKASSNWLGKAVMAAVVGFLVISFAIWGIGEFSAASAVRQWPRSAAPRSPSSSSASTTTTGCSNMPPVRPPDQLGPGARDGLDRLVDRPAHRRDRARRTRPRARPRRLAMPRSPSRSRPIPTFQGPNGQFDRARFEAMIRKAGFTEAALRRRAAPPAAAARARRHHRDGGLSAPKALIEAANRYQNEQRSIEYVLLDRAQAGEIPPPDAGGAGEVFRRAQNPVPRARIPQARRRVADPERAGQVDRNLRGGHQARL